MEKYVKHRMPYTRAIGLRYNPETKEMEHCEFELPGRLAVNRAQTRVRREEMDVTIIITDVQHYVRVMGVEIDAFLEIAQEL